MNAKLEELAGLHKLLHQSHQQLHTAFKEHVHEPVEVVHKAEEAPAQATGEPAAAPSASPEPPQQPAAPAAPPKKARRWM